MAALAGYQKNFVSARFKRAIFFAYILSFSCTSFAADGIYSASFSRNSVNSVNCTNNLRSFMQEGHATLGGTNHIPRHPHRSISTEPSYKTAHSLLIAYQIDTNLFLSLQNIACCDMPAYLQTKSYDELHAIKQSLEQFFDKYKNDKHFRKQVAKIKQVGIYKTIKIGKKKTFGHRKKISALKHYANHTLKTVYKAIENVISALETFCRNFLQTKPGKTSLYLLHRFTMGLKQGGIDIETVLRREKREGLCDFACDILQRAKTQPIRETLGDVTQLLSRTTINASAITVAVAAIAITIETGVAIATSTLGAIAAQKFFEPLALSINPDGTAVVTQAASSGVSVWQVITTSLGQAVATFSGLVEQAGNLFCAMEGSGGGGGKNSQSRGSTADLSKGTTLPRNLEEQLAVKEVESKPLRGLKLNVEMTDPRWPASEGWVKMHYRHGTKSNKIIVHYAYNELTGMTNDFKIKIQ